MGGNEIGKPGLGVGRLHTNTLLRLKITLPSSLSFSTSNLDKCRPTNVDHIDILLVCNTTGNYLSMMQ